MLTKLKPVVARIYGTEEQDLYLALGEPIGMRNLCDAAIKLFNDGKDIEPLNSVQINLYGSPIIQH